MRDYKFRGKRSDTGKWVYGDLITWWRGEGSRAICDVGGIRHDVIPETVGQFTGLKDKNGVEIYKGDICVDARGFRFIVIWDDDNARFLGRGIGEQKEYIRYVGQEPAVEVLGTIHDNPELLGGGPDDDI